MNYVSKLFGTSLEWLNLLLHFIVSDDIEENFLVFFTVKKSESDAGIAESTRSTYTVQVAFVVWEMMLLRNIKVYHKLDCVHVETSREQICCDYHIN